MGRKRKPEDEVRERINVRLPRNLIEEMKKHGSMTEVLEEAVRFYLLNKKKGSKGC